MFILCIFCGQIHKSPNGITLDYKEVDAREHGVQVLEWLMKFVANNVCMMWSCAMANVEWLICEDTMDVVL